ncbi:MAG: SDR family NAD(P)-dependent oxidoreductase [Thermoflavifilum aggregans]|nr:SDR family NAD(P)-dependent oxidoreductase [Thermoflavifilum aggregans]
MHDNTTLCYALITGASAGIGKALAEECARRKFPVLLVALPGDDLARLAQQIRDQYGVKTDYLGIDFLQQDSVMRVWEWCRDQHYAVRLLINNIGLGGRHHFEELQPEQITQMIRLNIQVTTQLTRVFIEELKAHRPAYILNVGSAAGFLHVPYKAVYSATKAYIYSFSRALRTELRSQGIYVSVLCPGGVSHKQDPVVHQKINGWLFRSAHERPEYVARVALDGLFRQRKTITPGWMSTAYYWLSRWMPPAWLDRVMHRLFAESEKNLL